MVRSSVRSATSRLSFAFSSSSCFKRRISGTQGLGSPSRHRAGRRQPPLPSSYSPRLNPIENAFAKLKALLRKAGERTLGALWDMIGLALQAFKPAGHPFLPH